jgi:predicted SprT family Zn-dependent metalloprotease
MNKLRQVEIAAKELIETHGLSDSYIFRYNTRKVHAGVCYYAMPWKYGRIELSENYVLLNDVADIMDTILHEIAHAIADRDYKHRGHGAPWKKVCVAIGAKPVRCYDDNVVMPKGKWQATCPNCQKLIDKHRLRRKPADYFHVACGQEKGILTFRKIS